MSDAPAVRTWEIREVRLLARHSGYICRLCKLAFTRTDASVYLVPYAPSRRFYSGSSFLAEDAIGGSFDFSEGTASDCEPKLSLHESGQVHVFSRDHRVGPLHSLPLARYRGEHVATVCVDRFAALPSVDPMQLRSAGSEIDLVVPVEDGTESGRLALYLNGERPEFPGSPCVCTVTLGRPTLQVPLYLCVKAFGQEPRGPASGGVTVLAGWNPSLPSMARQAYLYVRGI